MVLLIFKLIVTMAFAAFVSGLLIGCVPSLRRFETVWLRLVISIAVLAAAAGVVALWGLA